MSDSSIQRGQRVSWSMGDGQPRSYGRVVRLCTKDYRPAFSVTQTGTGVGLIIPAHLVRAERG